MSITKEVKKDLISKFSINDKDTGSSEVQIAVLTERINNLIELTSTSNYELLENKSGYVFMKKIKE